ncbi:MAG TPA: hypothetical protein VHG28_08145, partial [Longimicrobiaceae bacterium]|nr:hypothetical protein [Longimicrobiaceae bacterium]
EVVLPSHGPLFGDFAGRIDEILAHHEARNGEIFRLLEARGPLTAFEVAAGVFGELPPENFIHALRETRAHLIHLHSERRLETASDGFELWWATA